jgi:hypothetical protein
MTPKSAAKSSWSSRFHPRAPLSDGQNTAKISLTPTPPPYGNHFFNPPIACNIHEINSLHFHPVDESVTANLLFCPFFGLKSADLTPKWPLFRTF